MDLRHAILATGSKQREIAERLGVSEATMSKWVHRRADVPPRMIRPFAEALGVSVEDILPPAAVPEQVTV